MEREQSECTKQHQWNVEYDRNKMAKDWTIRTPSTTGLMTTPTSLYDLGCNIFNMNEYNTTLIQLGTRPGVYNGYSFSCSKYRRNSP